jgi:serine/threonine-protein kinase
VLIEVCNAVHFAHGRGVVHRDIKPDNVMIGAHGEIYLMDWGSAVRITDDGPKHVPHTREVNGIEGTPEYMAPELVGGKGCDIGVHTDVYLLGACLHEILTGKAPHEAASLRAALYRAHLSVEAEYSADVPEELAQICKKAMSRDPTRRHASAAELRADITAFLRHRNSLSLSREARTRAEVLEKLLAAVEIERIAAYKLFGECWFGFENALREWPDNVEAREGETLVLRAMIRYELDRRAAEAARELLAELREPEPDLSAKLEQLERELAIERRAHDKLTQLGREADTDVSRGERRRLVFALCALYGVVLLAFGVSDAAGAWQPSWGSYLAFLGAYGVALIVALLRWRVALTHNRINRRFVALISLSLLVPLMVVPLAHAASVPLSFALATVTLIHGTLGVSLAFLVHKRLAWSNVPFGLAFLAAALVPAHAFSIAGAAAIACTIVLAYQWREGDRVRALSV